jgi:hypothetical protein
MANIETGLTLLDVGYIGDFLTNLDKVFLSGSTKYPYPNIEYELLSGRRLWQKLGLKHRTPKLNHWVNLGMPFFSHPRKELYFDNATVLKWSSECRSLIGNMEFRIEKPLDFRSKFDNALIEDLFEVDKTGTNYFEVTKKCYLNLEDYDTHFILKGDVNAWPDKLDGSKMEYYAMQGWIYWFNVRSCDVLEICSAISKPLKLKPQSVLNAKGFIPSSYYEEDEEPCDLHDIDCRVRFQKRMENLEPFKTYPPFLKNGFKGLIEKKRCARHKFGLKHSTQYTYGGKWARKPY